MKKLLSTFHSVEYLRPRRRVSERDDFRLDVEVEIEEIDRKSMPVAFVYEGAADKTLTLYGHEHGLWRPKTTDPNRIYEVLTAKNSNLIQIGSSVYPPLGIPIGGDGKLTSPSKIERFLHSPDTKILSDDRERKTAIAHRAAKHVISVDGKIWIRTDDPAWMVRLSERDNDIDLLVDRDDFRPWMTLDSMLFRVDRLPEAMSWLQVLKGRKTPRTPTPDEVRAKFAEFHVAEMNPDYLSRDDVVEYGRTHLTAVVLACSGVLHAMPAPLRRRWEGLRDAIDGIDGPSPRTAAEIGLRMVPETLDLLEATRDIPDDARARLLKSITRLRNVQRRADLIEGIRPDPAAAISASETNDVELEGLTS